MMQVLGQHAESACQSSCDATGRQRNWARAPPLLRRAFVTAVAKRTCLHCVVGAWASSSSRAARPSRDLPQRQPAKQIHAQRNFVRLVTTFLFGFLRCGPNELSQPIGPGLFSANFVKVLPARVSQNFFPAVFPAKAADRFAISPGIVSEQGNATPSGSPRPMGFFREQAA